MMTKFDERLRQQMRAALAEVPAVRPDPAQLMARGKRGSARRRTTVLLSVAAGFALLGGGVAIAGPDDAFSRAAEIFQSLSEESPPKATIPPDHVLVATTAVSGFRTMNLWVTDPTVPSSPPGSSCFFLQHVENGKHLGGVGGCGGRPDEAPPALSRLMEAVVGQVGQAHLAAASATVSSGGGSASVPVVNGYFLVPSEIGGSTPRPFTIEFLDNAGNRIGEPVQLDG